MREIAKVEVTLDDLVLAGRHHCDVDDDSLWTSSFELLFGR